MATSTDFPNNCPTNVYTLNDFGEIAYIVCTVAAPPAPDPSAFVLTPENTLARLRRTERLFREASILAALDVEARQLFTFYKKVDIANAKDQKTLLSKFGFVLRSNACTIAYKTAARLPDLMKPEQARLYRLFTTAIVSSIKLLPNGDSILQPLGPSLYLVGHGTTGSEVEDAEPNRTWSLHRIDLQVIPSGNIILTIVKDDRLSFLRMLEVGSSSDSTSRGAKDSVALYLAPVGRVARLRRGVDHQLSFGQNSQEQANESQSLEPRKESWKETLPLWLKEHMNTVVETKDVPWVEAEVPVRETDRDSTDSQHSDISDNVWIDWRTIFWPANLCFLIDSKRIASDEVLPGGDDPLQFVQNWIVGTTSAPPTDSKPEMAFRDVADDDDEPLFAEDGTFDDPEHFQPFGPPAFPPSQTIYPTPPDVVMTHATPGMSSFDGIAMTPANLHRRPSEIVQNQDEDMADFEEGPPATGMTGFYDEDLFEEMPDDNFGQGGTGDEPNWDFFDRPDSEPKPTPITSSNPALLPPKPNNCIDENTDHLMEAVREDEEVQHHQEIGENKSQTFRSAADDVREAPSSKQSPLKLEKAEAHQHADVQSMRQYPSKPHPPLWEHNEADKTMLDATFRRQSSVYEGLPFVHTAPNRDSRYAANGDYWFDPSPKDPTTNDISKLTNIFRQPASSSSDSDSPMSTLSSPLYRDAPGNGGTAPFRQWTEYHPDSPGMVSHHSEIEKKSAQQEVQLLLTLLKPRLIEPPKISDFVLNEPTRQIQMVAQQKFLQIAHILVDQMSQTSLIPHNDDQNEQSSYDDQMEVVPDLTGLNTAATPSVLSQVVNIRPDNSTNKSSGRVVKLHPNQICVRRADQALIASVSIMSFWDTLNLQPESGTKHVTAFCIHPHAQNVTDGCFNLLQRIGEAYNACALGIHGVGRVSGLTDNGLVEWIRKGGSQNDLFLTCRRVGGALALAPDLKGTVVVYMISRNESPNSYLEVCQAFQILFESFIQAKTDKQEVFDIALQVIPQAFVADPEALVIPPQSVYLKLAIEVYNRLPPPDLTGPPASCGSAVVLAKADTSVHLHLTSAYGSPLTKNGPCLHLAYSISSDNRWITAAWTDEIGRIALTMSYCVNVRDFGKRRPRREILKEMFEVSQDLMSKVRGRWRLAIAKRGYYDPAELAEWRNLFEESAGTQNRCMLLLLSVQLHPVLRIFPQYPPGKATQQGTQNMYGTPASTPQASMTSPDQLIPATPTPGGSSIMNAPTPPDPGFDHNVDCDLTLIDPSEESWVIMLPYAINQSTSMNELRLAQATGMLMKRQGPKSEDGWTTIEISLINVSIQPAGTPSETSADELLEDLIHQYRGLVTLGITRGCIDPTTACLPWHIATAVRGSLVLGQVM